MVSVCTVPARGGRLCEHFGGYKTLNRIPFPLQSETLLSSLLPMMLFISRLEYSNVLRVVDQHLTFATYLIE